MSDELDVMKNYLLSFFFFLSVMLNLFQQVDAQNLVPNPSFEDTVACPDFPLPNISSAKHWSSYGNTCDYFNACANGQQQLFGVPSNFAGEQNANLGNAYAGLLTWYVNAGGFVREYIGVELTEPLIIGIKYYVSCYVSNGDSSGEAPSSTNNLGFRFSTVEYFNINGMMVPTDNFSHVHEDTLITNKTGWTNVAGSFIADSAYQYLAVGNFYDDAHTLIDTVGYPYGTGAYYYVDDVSVLADSLSNSVNNPSRKIEIKISPNPFTTQLQIQYTITQPGELMVYDALGRKVKSCSLPSNQKTFQFSLAELPTGVYLVAINSGGESYTEKVVKQ